jgi:hypothetical protein
MRLNDRSDDQGDRETNLRELISLAAATGTVIFVADCSRNPVRRWLCPFDPDHKSLADRCRRHFRSPGLNPPTKRPPGRS